MPGTDSFSHLNILVFAVLPYAAMILFLVVTIQRYRTLYPGWDDLYVNPSNDTIGLDTR